MNLSHCDEKLLEQRIPVHQIGSAQIRRRNLQTNIKDNDEKSLKFDEGLFFCMSCFMGSVLSLPFLLNRRVL